MASEGIAYLRAVQKARDSVPLPATVSELFDGTKLKPQYNNHRPAERALLKYHRRVGEAVQYQERLPVGIRQALHLPLVWVQIVNRYPWKVMWIRTDSKGRRRRGQKLCCTLGGAIHEQRRIARIAPNATVVSRVRGYDIPAELRGKLPPRWNWCPRCMKPRKFQRDEQDRQFFTLKKVWSREKQRYRWVERKVWVIVCPMCACTNQDPVYRRSNQPWETRHIKQGVSRTRKRRKGRR